MKEIELSATVERDGELHIRSAKLIAGQSVRAKLVIEDPSDEVPTFRQLRGIFKGTWGSAEAVDRYLREERDSWEQ